LDGEKLGNERGRSCAAWSKWGWQAGDRRQRLYLRSARAWIGEREIESEREKGEKMEE
jgi:hypothetical protein